MNVFDLSGKTILVTGASSGLGRQTAITISNYGARVCTTGRNRERLDQTFRALSGSGHLQVLADLTVQEELEQLVKGLPQLNGVVYSTGISDIVPTKFITGNDIEKNFSIGFNASVLLTSALQKHKKLTNGSCSLVFISTISTKYPFVGGAMYISARAALEGYARVLMLELVGKGIRVNCVSPGFVKGPLLESTQEQISKEKVEMIRERQPLGLGEPEDVANVILFFLSDASKWVTGTNLILGGG
jgi:NAD(P)-dependent dehydrogenase (short-subunit alcohol dehydrogenase family)